MNVAGPSSRVVIGRFTRAERFDSTYEEDLLGLLDQLSPEEIDELHTFIAHRMQNSHPSSDHDVAMISLLQQVRELAHINEDRVLAQRIADGDSGEDIRTEDSTDEENDGAESEDSTDEEDDGVESEDSTDEEDDGIASEESVHQQPRARMVRNRIARFLPLKSWITSFKSRLLDSKHILARPTRVALQNMPAVDCPTGHNCVICTDPIHSVEIRAPCGHYYDIGCATDLFQSATRDETLFPPRCCGQNVPFGRIRPHLSPALVSAFQQKKAEFSTLKRVYCSSPTCSRFLGPVSEGVFGGRVYSCPAPRCRRRTCGKCREQHSGDRTHVCRPDAGATQVLELSRASGWARCPGCSHMIELHLGCFHTTCRCGTEFCYLCHARWKTCECPQWDEQRLVVDEEEDEGEWHGLG